MKQDLKKQKRKGQDMHKTQAEKFVEKAREIESDENEPAFEEKLKRIAKAGPQMAPVPKPRSKRQIMSTPGKASDKKPK